MPDADSTEDQNRISRIQTHWSQVLQAGRSRSDLATILARSELASRYSGAIYRYLRRILASAEDAEDVSQEISVKILNGDFATANPAKGLFRDYMKTVVINAARRHKEKVAKLQHRSQSTGDLPDVVDPTSNLADGWEDCIREDLISGAMKQLTQEDSVNDRHYAATITWRLQNGATDATELASFLSFISDREYSQENARKTLQRARHRLAEVLLEHVRRTLPPEHQSPDFLKEHLAAIGLFEVCKQAL